MTEFTLPELGENVTSGDVVRVLVQAGDTVAKDQPVLELETDKATIEVPSLVAGRVKEIKVKTGDKISVGQVILSVEDGGDADKQPPKSQSTSAEDETKESASGESAAPRQPTSKSDEAPPETAPASAQVEASEKAAPDVQSEAESEPSAGTDAARQHEPPVADSTTKRDKVVDISRGARTAAESKPKADAPPAAAAPSVRRMARELGVDIHDVSGTGTGGRISADDVKAYVSRVVGRVAAAGTLEPDILPDFTRWGEVERKPMRGVRRKTAEHLAHAWSAVPHVTQHDIADVTSLEDLRQQYAKRVESAGGKLTVTAVLVKIVAAALRKFPQFNASVDMAAEEIVYKHYVHVGIAVDTDRGLLVPVIRDADEKSVTEIAVALVQLSEKARGGKLALDEMQGGSFSISNLGGIGGTAFTPIVNWPEVATLGISRTRIEPVFRDGQFVPRTILPLSLSYDHRLIDGADGIRFLRWIIDALEQPFLLTLET